MRPINNCTEYLLNPQIQNKVKRYAKETGQGQTKLVWWALSGMGTVRTLELKDEIGNVNQQASASKATMWR